MKYFRSHAIGLNASRDRKNWGICEIIIWQGKFKRSDWFFLGQDFVIRIVSMETVIGCVFFVFESRQIQNKHGPSAI